MYKTFSYPICFIVTALWVFLLLPGNAAGVDVAPPVLSAFGSGAGPSFSDKGFRLLDGSDTIDQSNALAFDNMQEGPFETVSLHCQFRVLSGDGGAFIFLNTAEYGRRGPAPFLKNWARPDLAESFAVGVDVHNPPRDELFGEWGNYRGMPEREVSLHWDGHEIVKRVAPVEFRGEFADLDIIIRHVVGGAEVTVRLAGAAVYDSFFIAGMLPYEMRLAIGAGTRDAIGTAFDVREIAFTADGPAGEPRRPKHVGIFNHVLIRSSKPAASRQVTLPPANWEFGRIILTLEIHDAGPDWDPWDRNGYFFVVTPDGGKYDIAPFITSFLTPALWQVDVTRFRPWLNGAVTFEISTTSDPDKDRGYMVSASLDFHHGTPELEPFRVVPLWNGTAKYGSDANHFSDFFAPLAVDIDAETEAARLFITTTGHSQVGEFSSSGRTLVFRPDKNGDPASERRFENLLWKDDNYLNPVRPQRGTWKYARAGWAPGDVVRPWQIDLTPWMIPGRTAELRYEPEPYDFSDLPENDRPSRDEINKAVHLVRSYLVLYRTPQELVPAPYLEVMDVLKDSNASKAGILAGDFLESYDGRRYRTIDALLDAIKQARSAGKKRIPVVVYRGSEKLELIVGPGRMGVLLAEE